MVLKTKEIKISEKGETVPVKLIGLESEKAFRIEIDGIEWVKTQNSVHANILFELIAKHIIEYMNYGK